MIWMIESQKQGAIVLFRSAKTPFMPDEIIRLEMLANELSTLIHVEQQRHGFTSMVERKKLVRILHDTVTQQLYGLLYFIDVAQAQLDYGTINSLSATLDKLGETGRQALKEMRMFLYSLQPVSVSKIGLIAAINQRLDAVEGRASVKTKFLVQGDVKLTLKQEICLYDITQEALNNILRHAAAKNVVITLKQAPKNIRLEIMDDGSGFDVKLRGKSGGIGLKNMRESAKQIHARISFHSSLEKGTRIKIILPRNRMLNIDKE
jgi:signal transduction histidine kinase